MSVMMRLIPGQNMNLKDAGVVDCVLPSPVLAIPGKQDKVARSSKQN